MPYQQLRDDEDDDQLKRVLSRKAGTFGLQSAAIKLGELREKVTKRDRSDGPPRRVGFDDETEGRELIALECGRINFGADRHELFLQETSWMTPA